METVIRRMKKEDAVICAKIQIASWNENYAMLVPELVWMKQTNPERLRIVYEAAAESDAHQGFLAYADGEAAVFSVYGPSRRSQDQRAAEIICVHTMPQYRGTAITGELMKEVMADIRQSGYTECYLWLFRDDAVMAETCTSLGFVRSAERISTWQAPEDMYRKTL